MQPPSGFDTLERMPMGCTMDPSDSWPVRLLARPTNQPKAIFSSDPGLLGTCLEIWWASRMTQLLSTNTLPTSGKINKPSMVGLQIRDRKLIVAWCPRELMNSHFPISHFVYFRLGTGWTCFMQNRLGI